MWGQLGDYFGTIQAGTTFRSFLAANSAQKYFLTALILSFCDIHDKSALVNILRQNMTIYLHGKWIDRKYIKRTWGNVESESLSISSFSLNFLTLSPFSRSPAARLQQVVQPWNYLAISWGHIRDKLMADGDYCCYRKDTGATRGLNIADSAQTEYCTTFHCQTWDLSKNLHDWISG